jgi:hypothetical protein
MQKDPVRRGGSHSVHQFQPEARNRSLWLGIGGHFGLETPVILSRKVRSFSPGNLGHFALEYAASPKWVLRSARQFKLGFGCTNFP